MSTAGSSAAPAAPADSLLGRLPLYLYEALGLGLFLLSACSFVVLLEHPGSPLRLAIDSAIARRAVMGLAMGLTAVALIYSPFGRRSGAHYNPSTTLAFTLLGRVRARDALAYALAQTAGGIAGVAAAYALLGRRLADPAVSFAATRPGAWGALVALVAEIGISFVLLTAVLRVVDSGRGHLAGLLAGTLVALYILVEAPLSGMSMNPARSLASAIFSGDLAVLWIYLVGPPLGMALAATLQARRGSRGCAKLVHAQPCHFCADRGVGQPVRKIVVLGGGFGGVYAARELARRVRGREDVRITLVAKENYFVFQPMLPEVISGALGLLDVVSPLRHLLPGVELQVREIEAIELFDGAGEPGRGGAAGAVKLAPGFLHHTHTLEFDHLVVALGNVTDFRGLRGLPEHALPFKNLNDALRLRNHVIRALEEAAIETDDPRLRQQLLTFVVAGGGFSGVEVAAELNDFVREVSARFPQLSAQPIRVVLVHSGERLLPEVSERLARFAEKVLARRGVEVMLSARLAAASSEEALVRRGEASERIPTRTLVSTVPSSPHPLVEALPVARERGRIAVAETLAVPGRPGLWALGDCAQVPVAGGGSAPPTAQHAIRQAQVLADNLLAALTGGRQRPFAFAGLGKMGSLGRRSAVAEILGVPVSGVLAWWLWRTIYLSKLPGLGRRLKVAASWTLDLFLEPDLVLLRPDDAGAVRREHFEPGQVVFQQGDVGDRVYGVVAGTAEVVRAEAGDERLVARLGPGDLFGEMALLDRTHRDATVRCAEGSAALDVWSLRRRDFEALAEGIPEVRASLERVRDLRRAAELAVGAG